MVTLETVQVPGYADAVRKEARLRDTAFLDALEIVCGIEVVPMSLRRLIWLEQARNGFVVPCRFDNEDEMLAHALQVVYFCRPSFKVPTTPMYSFWRAFRDGVGQHVFFRKALRSGAPEVIIKEVEEWLADAFMDSPAGSSEGVPQASYASYPAYIVDKFGEAGLTFTYSEIMDMPLRRLWQHYRMALRRVNDAKLTNPSDEIRANFVAGVGK
jgi:hypothetical protein